MRICSFLPSATEIVYALGLGDSLVGVSHECDYPADARSKRQVVSSRLGPDHKTSAEIHEAVGELTARGERVYRVDEAALAELRPDLVITQQLCEVCAVSYEDVQAAVQRLDPAPDLISLDPSSLGDVLKDIERVGVSAGATAAVAAVNARLGERIESVRAGAGAIGNRPKVACIEWLDPLITAGHWIPEMVEMAGGEDAMARPGEPSRKVALADVVDAAPDVVVLMPCGMDAGGALDELSLLSDLEQWTAIPAVMSGAVFATNAGSLYSRSGPRLVDGLELLAKMVHPEAFGEPRPEEGAERVRRWPR